MVLKVPTYLDIMPCSTCGAWTENGRSPFLVQPCGHKGGPNPETKKWVKQRLENGITPNDGFNPDAGERRKDKIEGVIKLINPGQTVVPTPMGEGDGDESERQTVWQERMTTHTQKLKK